MKEENIDDQDRLQEAKIRKRKSRLEFFSHTQDLLSSVLSNLYNAILILVIYISIYKITYYGIYESLEKLIAILNSIDWSTSSLIIALVYVKAIHSLFLYYFRTR